MRTSFPSSLAGRHEPARRALLLLLLLTACRVDGRPSPAPAEPSAAPATRATPATPPIPATPPTPPTPGTAPPEAPLAFVERVTGGADPTDTLPLVIALHGLGDTPERFIGLYTDLPLKARVVAPRAPTPHGRGASWFPIAGGSGAAAREAGIRDSAARIAALADWCAAHRPTLGRPVVSGFSQGGILSFALAARHPGSFAGAVPIAGALPESFAPASGKAAIPVRALHGADDARIPLDLGRRAAAALGADLKTYPGVGHQVTADMRRDLHAALVDLLPP